VNGTFPCVVRLLTVTDFVCHRRWGLGSSPGQPHTVACVSAARRVAPVEPLSECVRMSVTFVGTGGLDGVQKLA
jgi:hypothetical protein